VTVTARDERGLDQRHTARFVIDASGRGNLTGNQEGVRDVHPRLRKLAVFGHFTGVKLDEGTRGGDTVIVRLENKWFWIIPLDSTKTSVGLVMERDELAASSGRPEEIFQRWLDSSVAMTTRMTHARAVTPIHVTSDFSYRNRTFFSPRVVRVGDAAGFLDPIFSSGVFLAMHSGKMATQAVVTAMARGSDGTREFAPYQRRFQSSFNTYWTMVEKFYTTPFIELFLEPRDRFGIAFAINAILAGELEGGWRLWWRLRVFFLLVRLQARMALVPHVSFVPVSKPAA
jgi:FADH2-dependent halogenase